MNTRLVGILIDSFPKILINGLTVTLPLTIISFALALVIALITALVQTAKIPVLRQLARFYVWVIRGTPVLVQLPQALRTAFPPLFNSLISLLKDTSLAANITVTEMFMATQRIVARTYESLPLYLEVAFIYLMFSTILTQVQRWGEKKLNAKGFSQNS